MPSQSVQPRRKRFGWHDWWVLTWLWRGQSKWLGMLLPIRVGGHAQVERVAVLGAGLMGAGIAEVSAQKGMTVLLKDR